ncbi:MAG: hypothetical protein V4631_03180 [Pseudomonadota bacterium]
MRKQLFYLTNQQLTAYSWQAKVLTREAGFDNDDAGRLLFGAYLAQLDAGPSYLLVDVIEEDFQRDTAPHVTGRARLALVERKLTQLYRDTQFRHAELQGRDKEGRKDDRYLFNALTKPELPKSWLAVMQTHAVPLVGVYSLASLSQLLFDKLKLDAGPVLLVSHQSSGLRQSFFHEGALRFSRLTPLFDHAPARLAEAFRVETNKTRQFMASTRLLARGAQVRVVVVANQEHLAALAADLVDTPDVSYRAIALEQASGMLRAGQFDGAGECDPLYLALLASARVPTHFPLRDQRHFYQLLQTRMLLYGLSGVVALAALAWTAIDLISILELRTEAARLEQEAAATEVRFQGVIKGMPATLVTPHNMKAVVDIEAMIDRHVPLPNVQLRTLGGILGEMPEITVNKLHWQALEPATLLIPVDPTAPPPAPVVEDFPPMPGLLGIPDKTAQILVVEGEILPFDGDYRAAINSVTRLAARLNAQAGVRAEITLQPLDTRPTVKLDNVAGDESNLPKALFALKVTWKP